MFSTVGADHRPRLDLVSPTALETHVRSAYQSWKNQVEFQWLTKYWFPSAQHIYPIGMKADNQKRKLDPQVIRAILLDFLVLPRWFENKRLSTIPTPTDQQLIHQNAVAVNRILAKIPAPSVIEDAATTVAMMIKDMTLLTQERDTLRRQLLIANEENRRLKLALATPPPPPPPSKPQPSSSVPAARPVSVVDQAPPPPIPDRVIPSVAKPRAMGLLDQIQKGKVLRKSVPETPPSSTPKEESSLETAILRRRASIANDDESTAVDDSEWTNSQIGAEMAVLAEVAAIGCAMCYSEGVMRCSQCKEVYYCGASCQKTHWESGHIDQCIHSDRE